MATQTEQVVALLRSRGDKGVTQYDLGDLPGALKLIGTARLASRINDARQQRSLGLLRDDEEIVTERVSVNGKTFARYVLRKRATPGLIQTSLDW